MTDIQNVLGQMKNIGNFTSNAEGFSYCMMTTAKLMDFNI